MSEHANNSEPDPSIPQPPPSQIADTFPTSFSIPTLTLAIPLFNANSVEQSYISSYSGFWPTLFPSTSPNKDGGVVPRAAIEIATNGFDASLNMTPNVFRSFCTSNKLHYLDEFRREVYSNCGKIDEKIMEDRSKLFRQFSIIPTSALQYASTNSVHHEPNIFRATHPCGMYEVLIIPTAITQLHHDGVDYSIVQVTYPSNTTDNLPDNCNHRITQKGICTPYNKAMKDYSGITTPASPSAIASSNISSATASPIANIPREQQLIPKSIPQIPFPFPLNNTHIQIHPMHYNFSLPALNNSKINAKVSQFNSELERPGTTTAPPSQPFRPDPIFLQARPEVLAALAREGKKNPQTPLKDPPGHIEFLTFPYPQINNVFSILQGLFPDITYDILQTQTGWPNTTGLEAVPFVIPFSLFFLDIHSLESVYTFIIGLLHLQTWRNQQCSFFPVNREHELILPKPNGNDNNIRTCDNGREDAHENACENSSNNNHPAPANPQYIKPQPSHQAFKVLLVIYNAERLDTQPILTKTLDELAAELDMEFSYQYQHAYPVDPNPRLSHDKIDIPSDNRLFRSDRVNNFISAQFYQQAVDLGHFIVKNILSQYLLSHHTYCPQESIHRTHINEISFELHRQLQEQRSTLLNSTHPSKLCSISPHFPRTFDSTLSIHPKYRSTRPILQQYYILYEKYLRHLDEVEARVRFEDAQAKADAHAQLHLQQPVLSQPHPSITPKPRCNPNQEQKINLDLLLNQSTKNPSANQTETSLFADIQLHHIDFPIYACGSDIYEYFSSCADVRPIFEHVLIQDPCSPPTTPNIAQSVHEDQDDSTINQNDKINTKTPPPPPPTVTIAPFHPGSGLFCHIEYAQTRYLEPSLRELPENSETENDPQSSPFLLNQLAPISTTVSKYTPYSTSPLSHSSPTYHPNSLLPIHSLPFENQFDFSFTSYTVPNSVYRYAVSPSVESYFVRFLTGFSRAQGQTAIDSASLHHSSISYRSLLSNHLKSTNRSRKNAEQAQNAPSKLHHFFVNCSVHATYPVHSPPSAHGLQISPQGIPGIVVVQFGYEESAPHCKANFLHPLLHLDPFRAHNIPVFLIFVTPPRASPIASAVDFNSGTITSANILGADNIKRSKGKSVYKLVEEPSSVSSWTKLQKPVSDPKGRFHENNYLKLVAEQNRIRPSDYNNWFTTNILQKDMKSMYKTMWSNRRLDLLNIISSLLYQHLGDRSYFRNIAKDLSTTITATSQIIPILKSACEQLEIDIQPFEAKYKQICALFDDFDIRNEAALQISHADPQLGPQNLSLKARAEAKSALTRVQTSLQQFKSLISIFEARAQSQSQQRSSHNAAPHATTTTAHPVIDELSEQPPPTPYKIYQYVISVDQLADTLRNVRELALVEYLTNYTLIWDNPNNPALYL